MPATPAWPPKSLPRLFVRQRAGRRHAVELDASQANYLGNVMRLGVGAELLLFDGASGEWLARIAEAAQEADDAHGRAPDARAGDDPRRLARLRAGQARADRLAGREGDRARRRAAAAGDDPADDRRAGEARAAASDRDRGGRAVRPDARCRRSPSRCRSTRFSTSCDPRRGTSISPTKAAASRSPTAFQRRPGADPDRPRGRLHRRGARTSIRGAGAARDLARPAHPARRDRRARSSAAYMAVAGDWRLSTHKAESLARCTARLGRAAMTTRTDDSYSPPDREPRRPARRSSPAARSRADDWRIGTEHEKFVYRIADHRAPSYDEPGGIRDLLEGLTDFGWEPVIEDGNVIALERRRRQRSASSPPASSSCPARRSRTSTRPAPRRRATSTSARRSASGSGSASSASACGPTRRAPSCRSCPRAATRSCSTTCRRSAPSAST